jgi:hypothetical protein
MSSSEKRGATRQAFHHKCWVVMTDGGSQVLAHISDISPTGALLITAAPQDVPDEFTLNLTEDGAVHRRCRVSRRTDDEIGIAFLPGRHR